MIIVLIEESAGNIMVVRLPHANMIVDPRFIGGERYTFSFSVNGRILTITRIDEDTGWDDFRLRAYLPTETIPDFTSTVYTYWGLDNEDVPEDTTKVNFHPSVRFIKNSAFLRCTSLVRITIPDHVTTIEKGAFYGCDSLRSIQLPRNLEFIGDAAFAGCTSLEGVFVPSFNRHTHWSWCLPTLHIIEILLRASTN